jgi:YD repeat-containing protein
VRAFIAGQEKNGVRDDWSMWKQGPLAVNKMTGNFVLALPGPSYAIAVGSMGASLTYNSLDARDRGFGVGWTLNGGADHGATPTRLVDLNNLGETEKMDATEVFYADGGSALYTHVGQTNTYIADAGDGSLLSKNADGTWTLTDVDGSLYTFAVARGTNGEAHVTAAEVVDAAPGKGKLTYAFSTSDPSKITSVTDGAGRSLTFTWNSLNSAGCSDAILCITGPDNVRWRYIGEGSGGTSGRLLRVNNGTRDLAAVEYDAVGRVYKIRNANDLDPTAASPGYEATHVITVAYYANHKVQWISDGPISGQTATTWFYYYPDAVSTTPTRAAHGGLPAGSVRTAAGYTLVKPPSQHTEPNPKFIKSYYDGYGHEIEAVDILGNITMAGYGTHDQPEWTEDEDGNPTDHSWDTVNDVLLSTTGPDPDGAGPLSRPVTSNRYDETQIGTASTPGAALEGLQASYYDNINLAGRAKVRQTDPNVDFNWGANGPAALPGVSDNFSVRWTGNLIVPTDGHYVFTTSTDDGTRLTIDKTQVIDNWVEQPLTAVNSRSINLSAGKHKLLLEYFEATNTAQVQLRWSCLTCTPTLPQETIPSSALRPAWLNQTSTVSPLGKVAFSHYADPAAMRSDYSLARLADGTNVITSYSHDDYGRITQKVMPKGNATRTIDAQGNLQGSPDLTYATTWTYYNPTDTAARPAACGGGTAVNQGELLKDVTPRGVATTTMVYDIAGRRISETKGIGTLCRAYDSEGHITNANAPGDSQATQYTYDPSGAQRTASDGSGVVTFEYDEAGRIKRSIDSLGAEATFSYDVEGNRTQRTAAVGSLSVSTNYTTSYTYDAKNQVSTITDPAGRQYAFTHDNRGKLRATQYPNGTFAWQDYDAAGALKALYNRHGTLPSPLPAQAPVDASPVVDLTYDYDLEGRKLEEIRTGGNLAGETTSYVYDELGRLSEMVLPDGTVRRYVFDLDSNRTQIRETPLGGNESVVASYTYDPANPSSAGVDQLTSVTTGGQTRTLTYSADGEVTCRGATGVGCAGGDTISWNGWGHVAGGTFGGVAVSYEFDPLGRRRSRVSAGVNRQYRFDGSAQAPLFETDSNAVILGFDVLGPAGDLARYAGPPASQTSVSYLYYNGHGDVTAEADSAGARTASYTYDAFGSPRQTAPPNALVERWAGRWDKSYDSTSGLEQMGARPYDQPWGASSASIQSTVAR